MKSASVKTCLSACPAGTTLNSEEGECYVCMTPCGAVGSAVCAQGYVTVQDSVTY